MSSAKKFSETSRKEATEEQAILEDKATKPLEPETHRLDEHSHDNCDHEHDHDNCDHEHNREEEELLVDEAFVAESKARYPEPLWTFFTQKEIFPEMDKVFKDITDFDLLRVHIDDLVRLALDDALLTRDPKTERIARAPHLALHTLSAMGIPDPEIYEKLATLQEREELHDLVGYALMTLFQTNPEPAFEALINYYDNIETKALPRHRTLCNLLSISLQSPEEREERAKRIGDFLYRPQSNDVEKNREQNALLIDLIMAIYEGSQDASLTQLVPIMQEAFDEGRVDTTDINDTDMDAVFGEHDVSTEMIQKREPTNTVYLICKECRRVFSHQAETIYYDPLVVHVHLYPEECEEDEKEAIDIEPIWLPEPFHCPRCDALNSYQLSFRGYKLLFAEFLRMVESFKQEKEYKSPYQVMNFTFLGSYTHPIEAIELAYHAIKEYPHAAAIRIDLARLLARQGSFNEAKEHLLRAIEADPGEPGSYKGMAWLAEEQDLTEEAVGWWMKLQDKLNQFDISQVSRQELRQELREALTRLKGSQYATQQIHQRAGRNDPCPCGSGKKYKKCCLQRRAQ